MTVPIRTVIYTLPLFKYPALSLSQGWSFPDVMDFSSHFPQSAWPMAKDYGKHHPESLKHTYLGLDPCHDIAVYVDHPKTNDEN